MSVVNSVQSVAHAHPVSASVALTTTGTGLVNILDLIPDEIGKLASLIGIVLSIVLIYFHIINTRKVMRERAIDELVIRKVQLENEIMEMQIRKLQNADH